MLQAVPRDGWAGQPLPDPARVFEAMLQTAFRGAAGRDRQGSDPIPVMRTARPGGGLSSGRVDPR